MSDGPENIEKYITLVISKFNVAHGYSEVPITQLRESIRKHLIEDHNRAVRALSEQLQFEQAQNMPINRDWYQNEMAKVRQRFLMKVEELSLNEKL